MLLRLDLVLLGMVALIGGKFTFAKHLDLAASCEKASRICLLHIDDDDQLFANSFSPELRYVVISDSSSLTYLPNEIFQYAPKLEHIAVDKGGISQLSTDDFAGAQKLRTVTLAYNQLSEITNNTFKEAASLEEIHLPGNKIRKLHSAAFAGLIHLNYLDLSDNEIVELPTDLFSVILNLEHIDLSDNLIEMIDVSTFTSNVKLRAVLLNDNKFSLVEPNALLSLERLNMLNISNNEVTELALDTLEELYAANSSLERCTFEGVARVEAPHNQLTSFTVHLKASVSQLQLQYNQFETLDDFQSMVNLNRLDISHNNIKRFITGGERVMHLPSLKYLNLAWNQLSEMYMNNFLGMDELDYLDLSYNKLTHLDAGVFSEAIQLRYLYLEGNHLQKFDFSILRRNNPLFTEIGLFGNDWPEAEFARILAQLKGADIRTPNRTELAKGAPQSTTLPEPEHSIPSPNPTRHHHSYANTDASSASNEVLHDKLIHRHHVTSQMQERTQATTGVTGINSSWTAQDFMTLMTLVLVMIILVVQFYKILLQEQNFRWCRRRVPSLNGVAYTPNRNHLVEEDVSAF